MNPASKPRPASVPRHWLFAAVRSGARTAQIGPAAVIFRKTPYIFRKSTRAPEALSEYFIKNTSDYFEINPQSRRRARAAGQTRRPPLLPSFLPRASPCLQRLLRPSLAPHFSPLGVLSAQGQVASSLPPQAAVGTRRRRGAWPPPSSLSLPLSRHGAAPPGPDRRGLLTLCAAVDPGRGRPPGTATRGAARAR